MCGICGEWRQKGARASVLAAMSSTLRHRGPDDEGSVVAGPTGLAMRRLSIIDVEGGHQPIANESGDCFIVCNGEIYNHEELRRELQARGHRFSTRSDTEVILHLYEERGEHALDALRGMFAFALWDGPRKRLLLARDRFGQKPLFYALENERLVFGSEIKAVLAGREAPNRLDRGALDDFLSLRFVPSPFTMLEGVFKLPPGHLLVLEESRVRPGEPPPVEVRRYWRLRFAPKRRIALPQALGELREQLTDAATAHLVSDVRVGAYLSGGMDSSVLVALLSKQTPGPLPTFAVGVKETDFDELPFARMVADRYRTEHHEKRVSADLASLLPRIVHFLDEPSDPIAACMYQAAALASRHVKVVVGGDGGDELFAGFDRYYGFSRVGAYAALPAFLRRALLGPLLRRLPDRAGYKNLTQKLRWMHELSFSKGARRYAQATLFFRFGAEDKRGLYTDEFARSVAGNDAADCIVEAFEAAEADCDLDRMLSCDMDTRMTEHSLMLTDRMTMAHGLEGRSPLLDHRLAEFVATLPASYKLRGKSLKFLLRELARELLPEPIVKRPKQGFMFPLGYWMKGPLLPVLRRLLGNSRMVEAGVFRKEAVSRLLQEHLADRADHHVRLWMLLNLEVWHRMALDGESVTDLEEEMRELYA